MALKALLESLDGIDDAVKPLYAETDGKFVLQIEGVDDHPDVANLKSAYARTNDASKAAKAEAATLKAQIAELQKGAPDTAATQAKIADLQAKLDSATAEVGTLNGRLTGVTRDQALTTALQKAGITDPVFLKASQAMHAGAVKLGDDGLAYVDTPMGPKVLDSFIAGWAAAEGGAFVSKPSGGDAKGNQGGSASTGLGNMGGTKAERQAALKQRFPDLK